ncbi:MAG TPA: HAMP domain-containing protein [Spirochaetes bacterium]|nr:HAMP domain-containing protein [Spirochaetota bacterium]
MYPLYLNNNYFEYKTNIPKTRLINQLALVFFKLVYGPEKQNIKENHQTSDIFDSNQSNGPIKLSVHYHIKQLQSRKSYYVFTGLGINPLNLKIANDIKQINNIKMNKEDAIEPAKKYIKLIIYLISAPTLLIAILISFFMARSLLRPIQTLISGTKEVAKGNLEFQIQEIGKGELGDLIQSFNYMTSELLRNKDELYRIEKVAAWRDVARNLAHEIKNPLTPIKLASERLIRQYQLNKKNFGDVLKNCSKIIISEVERLKVLVNEFSEFARFPKIELNEESIIKIISDIYTIYETSHPDASFRVENRLESVDEILLIDKEKIKQVFINLIDNSLDANDKNLEIIIYLNYINSDDKNYCQIEVSDNGTGIPQIDMIHIFEPYYTTKKRGTGLGLSIVKNIIEEHEGHVYVHSQYGFGTSFYIELPYKDGVK